MVKPENTLMNEAVKIDVKINRKTILLLNSVIKSGINNEPGFAQDLIKLLPAEDVEQLQGFASDCLDRGGLKELSEKMKKL